MTPKEKALELALRYAEIGAGEIDIPDETAIQSALICVDEKFKPDFIGGKRYDLGLEQILYWQEVKNEIEKL